MCANMHICIWSLHTYLGFYFWDGGVDIIYTQQAFLHLSYVSSIYEGTELCWWEMVSFLFALGFVRLRFSERKIRSSYVQLSSSMNSLVWVHCISHKPCKFALHAVMLNTCDFIRKHIHLDQLIWYAMMRVNGQIWPGSLNENTSRDIHIFKVIEAC